MMDFLVDYQTVSDLQIFPDEKADMSVYKLFDHAKTHGGKARLKNIRFYFFDAEAKNDIPTYTYQVKKGLPIHVWECTLSAKKKFSKPSRVS